MRYTGEEEEEKTEELQKLHGKLRAGIESGGRARDRVSSLGILYYLLRSSNIICIYIYIYILL